MITPVTLDKTFDFCGVRNEATNLSLFVVDTLLKQIGSVHQMDKLELKILFLLGERLLTQGSLKFCG